MNTWIGTGRLTDSPTVRNTQSGKSVCSFTIAIDDRRGKSDDQNQQRKATFVPIVVWDKNGENCGQYLEKGQMVTIQGRLQIRSYTDKDGIKRRAAEIVASNVEFGQKARGSASGQQQAGAPAASGAGTYGTPVREEEIPF